ncbi:response regulator transcription factor [Cohaesibacter celericrescens]|uniref:DNA-binding response regulator n=1 Tax=Cohaesibacter celericrescens TaxID=2067669 RepID=A0A2N5XKC7_9HYPH|nr:response regulator [Cohaesibacter celericrescens]PLW74890.1 DNA-binding response regulator [Cohaesibacter celericrescens]
MTTDLHPSINIVDDDPAVRDALSVLFELEGYQVETFSNGEDFLAHLRESVPSAILLDVHMPGRSGLEVMEELTARHIAAPVLIISGQGDIPMAVAAIKQGAHDFIEKPFDGTEVVNRIEKILANVNKTPDAGQSALANWSFPHAEALTPRERDVLLQITQGASNKEAGLHLAISPRTIEVHRARIMEKLKARNTADLVRIVLTGH